MAEAIRAGILPSAAGDGGLAWIDPADVADVATAILLDYAGYVGQVLKLTGPKALTYDNAATAREGRLSVVTGTVENVLGRPPRTFDQWLAENKDRFAA